MNADFITRAGDELGIDHDPPRTSSRGGLPTSLHACTQRLLPHGTPIMRIMLS
jgi:hypothetical protein